MSFLFFISSSGLKVKFSGLWLSKTRYLLFGMIYDVSRTSPAWLISKSRLWTKMGVTDDYIGKFALSVTPGTKEVEIEGTVFKIVRVTYWIKVTSLFS
jgi:hypothetical protein